MKRSYSAKERRKAAFKRTTKPKNPRSRLLGLLGLFIIVGVACIAVLIDLQVVRAADLREKGESERIGNRPIAGYRGDIVDRNGFVLASSTSSHQVFADPSAITNTQETASLLAPVLDIDPGIVQAKLQGAGQYSLLKRSVSEETVDVVQAMKTSPETKDALSGIHVRAEESRAYPSGDLGISLIGKVDFEEHGTAGIEKKYDDLLTGVMGVEEFERGRFGSEALAIKPARQGFDVVLTVDHRLQYIAEKTLIKHCEEQEAKGASLVMSSPSNGEILVMASVSQQSDGSCAVSGYTKPLVDSFEPGSVVKPFVVAGVFEELGYGGNSTVVVPPSIRVGGVSFRDTPVHAAAPFPVSQILEDSMNVGTIELAKKLGNETVYDYLKKFGMGEKSGLEIKNETRGRVRPWEEWRGSDAGSIPIGQGVTSNLMQLSTAYNVFANGGYYQKPSLVKSLRSSEQSDLLDQPTEKTQIISAESANKLSEVLRSVVDNGTGKKAAIEGYSVGGKTGTAWKVFDDGTGKFTYGSDGNRKYVTTFVGFAPVEDPLFSMAVSVDEPKKETAASLVAAPIFSEVGEYALHLYGIPSNDIEYDGSTPLRSKPAGISEEVVEEKDLPDSEIAE